VGQYVDCTDSSASPDPLESAILSLYSLKPMLFLPEERQLGSQSIDDGSRNTGLGDDGSQDAVTDLE
jgi:hypothetical protein